MTNPVPAEISSSPTANFSAGQRLFEPGDLCNHFVFLQSGSVRVELVSETGHSLLLYRLGPGSSCILTTACLLGGDRYSAQATVESPGVAYMVNRESFQRWLAESMEFRQFVFSSFSDRLISVLQKIDDVAFLPIERRLAAAVLQRCQGQDSLSVTHEQLASDIGSAREVVSRRLARWESDGIIRRGRGTLDLVNRAKLLLLSNSTEQIND